MLNPQFPYTGNQIILSSERVLIHSKSDGIFLFGKQMVALSSTQTINLDAKEKILIDCDKIELGNRAESLGDPIIKGKIFMDQFIEFVKDVQFAASQLQTVSETNSAASFINIQTAGDRLFSSCARLSAILKNTDHPQNPLSKNTYTR
jgi:hypothetical protein